MMTRRIKEPVTRTWRYHLGTRYPQQTFEVGDKVGYARYFIKQLGVAPTDRMWSREGVVVEVVDGGFLGIKWRDNPTIIEPIHAQNVAKVGTAAWAD